MRNEATYLEVKTFYVRPQTRRPSMQPSIYLWVEWLCFITFQSESSSTYMDRSGSNLDWQVEVKSIEDTSMVKKWREEKEVEGRRSEQSKEVVRKRQKV